MWWLIPIAIVALGFIVVVIARRMAADRRRSTTWDDLRERGKLMTSQLAHLKDVQSQRQRPKS